MNTRASDVPTSQEASELLPELVDSLGCTQERFRVALNTIYGEEQTRWPASWYYALGLLQEARRKMLCALGGEEGTTGPAGEER